MARLVEIQACQDLSPVLHVRVGDILMFGASGAHLLEGDPAVELLGIFSTAVISGDGHVLNPAGPPTNVMFRALQPGRAHIDLIRGDPWQATSPPQQIAIVVAA